MIFSWKIGHILSHPLASTLCRIQWFLISPAISSVTNTHCGNILAPNLHKYGQYLNNILMGHKSIYVLKKEDKIVSWILKTCLQNAAHLHMASTMEASVWPGLGHVILLYIIYAKSSHIAIGIHILPHSYFIPRYRICPICGSWIPMIYLPRMI